MIKFEIDKEHRIRYLEVCGGHATLVAEVAMLVGAIYAQTSGLNPQVAERFKESVQINTRSDSPTWDPPEEWKRVGPDCSVTTTIFPRRDDGETL